MIGNFGRCACVALSVGLFNSLAMAQVTGYEVIDLGTLPNAASPYSQAWAINDLHEIVGSATSSQGAWHATVWLYCPNYGLAEQEWHDLTNLAGESESGEAHDINMSGLVVGRQEVSTSGSAMRGYIWNLASSPITTTELSTFIGGATTVGFATAVNDSNPAIVVGNAQASLGCAAPFDFEAFSYQYGDPPNALIGLGANSGDLYSMASGITNTTPPMATGRSTSELCVVHGCLSDHSAVNWTLTPPPVMTTLLSHADDRGAQGWGINDAGHSVGFAFTELQPCIRHAAFWENSTASPIDLGSIGISGSYESRAYRINEASASGEVTVVGDDNTSSLAYRWHRNGAGNWSGVDLNTLISPLCGWLLTEAHDISSDGWITGSGWVSAPGGGAPEHHAFLLKPIECEGDLDGSCSVNGKDLTYLLSAWNCVGPCSTCMADIDRDGQVNGTDLTYILSAWGNSCECWACPSAARASSSDADESSQRAEAILMEGLALLGFDSITHFNDAQSGLSETQRAQVHEWLFIFLTTRIQ